MHGIKHSSGCLCEYGSMYGSGSRTYGVSEHGTGHGVVHGSSHSAGYCSEYVSLYGTGSRA